MDKKLLTELDQRILQNFVERMEQGTDFSKLNTNEREYLLNIAESAGDKLGGYARIFFSTLLDLSHSYHKSLRSVDHKLADAINGALSETPQIFPNKGVVACQGCEGAYSQQACDKIMPFANIVYVKNFEGVFQAVENGLCEYGILPIENSLHGTVGAVYDLMQNYKFHVIRSFKLQISHSLLVNPGVKLADIKEVVSHEQALGQCSNFLKDLKNVKNTVCENTAVAARYVADSGRKDVAAISSKQCARLYDLAILSEDIQNSDHNFTRFICISKNLRIYPGANRISLIVSVPHRPGALYRMIAKFSALGLNLVKLESRPIPGKNFEFMFYFDLEASVYSPEVLQLLDDLSNEPETFVLLGCYTEI
ncbi:MAG: prephenate dehydratase [Lentisphaeria bacterium]|nr:prephenate dehydratase [Lentisphaeria bacterium]